MKIRVAKHVCLHMTEIDVPKKCPGCAEDLRSASALLRGFVGELEDYVALYDDPDMGPTLRGSSMEAAERQAESEHAATTFLACANCAHVLYGGVLPDYKDAKAAPRKRKRKAKPSERRKRNAHTKN